MQFVWLFICAQNVVLSLIIIKKYWNIFKGYDSDPKFQGISSKFMKFSGDFTTAHPWKFSACTLKSWSKHNQKGFQWFRSFNRNKYEALLITYFETNYNNFQMFVAKNPSLFSILCHFESISIESRNYLVTMMLNNQSTNLGGKKFL